MKLKLLILGGAFSVGVFLLVQRDTPNVVVSQTSNLRSESPTIRATAAKALRDSYRPPPQSNWDSLIARLKVGDNLTNIERILTENGITNKGAGGGGGAGQFSVEYRLDDSWLLRCRYHSGLDWQHPEKGTLLDRSLRLSLAYCYVPAPTNFTGVWSVYYINGQKCLEINLKDGVREGDLTCYSFDGSKVYVEKYNLLRGEIGWTDYYSSGQIKTIGKLDKADRPIGIWTNYSGDGAVVSTTKW